MEAFLSDKVPVVEALLAAHADPEQETIVSYAQLCNTDGDNLNSTYFV